MTSLLASLGLARMGAVLAVFCFFCLLPSFSGPAEAMPGGGSGNQRPQRRHGATTVLNLRDYGALGDGLANDSPALQQALDDLASSGGGTLQVPAGQYLLVTPVFEQFAPGTEVRIEGEPSSTPIDVAGNGSGLDLTSEFIVAVGETSVALVLTGSDSLVIRDLAFVGVQEARTDARVVLAVSDIRQTTIQHCEFYGLASLVPGGGIVVANSTDLRLEQSAFLGCAANSGLNTSIVQTNLWLGIEISDCKFIDYGNRPDFFSKTPLQSPYSWIGIGRAAALEPTRSRREAIIKHVFLDEGSYFGIAARPDLDSNNPEPAAPASFPPYEIYLSRLNVNVNNLNSDGVFIFGARKVFIEQSHFGWSTNAGVAINLSGVDEAVLDLIDCSDDATRLRVDAQRLAVINSVYTSLDSGAPFTRIITTDTPEEDPAQYVRQQYLNALKHDPDPAGHFYWTDQMVRCDADASCLSEVQAALAVFLSATPPARFALSGRVIDEAGAPLVAVNISLSGSQTVAMETDANGNFSFTNLATAGSYVLTPAKTHYTFAGQPLVTPTTDQVRNFTGTLIRHAISGRVFSNNGQALADATLRLSGSQDDLAISDADGNFSFPDLAGGGDYVVSVERDNFVFDVSTRAFNDLSADKYFVFEGRVPKYTISGRLTRANGSSMSGVTVALSGTETGVVTTDNEGSYSFSVSSGGDFIVTPQEPHYTFSPFNLSVNNLRADQLANFTGSLNGHTIAGRVFTNTGRALAGATVTLSGDQTETTVSDLDGDFVFSDVAAGGEYVVSVSRANYTFALDRYSFSDLTTNKYVAFEGVVLNYVIAGRVAKADGTPLNGAVVTLSGGLGSSTTTGMDGNYSFTVHAEDNYTVRPSLSGYGFTPANQTFTNVSGNQNANFSGTLVYVVSGQVKTPAGAYLSGVTITVTGSHTGVSLSDQNASFELELPADGDYTITASRPNYTFSPSSITVNDLGADQVRNFIGELSPGVPVMLTGLDPSRAVAIDSVLRTGEPFKLESDHPWNTDRRTRIMLFATHFDLLPGEGATGLTATVEDATNQIYPLTVEYAGKVEGFDWLTCIVVRLSDQLTEGGDVLVQITYRGLSSEPMRIAIAHPADGSAANVTRPKAK